MTRRLGAGLLASLAVTTVLYRTAVSLGVDLGWVDRRSGSAARGDVMSAVTVLALVVGGACAWTARRQSTHEGGRRVVGAVMVAAGWTWFAWGVTDHYLFDQWQLAEGTLASVWETLFHGAGVAVGIAGWRQLGARRPRDRAQLLDARPAHER